LHKNIYGVLVDWEKFVIDQIGQWKKRMSSWIPDLRHGGILHYENLILNHSVELRKLVKYLSLPVDERRLECTIKHNYKTFHRNSTLNEKM